MVERPIKKSERQAKINADSNTENAVSNTENIDSAPPVESTPKVIKKIGDRKEDSSERRSSGKGKKSSYREESKPPVNPALARGPKPVKPKPSVTVESETATETMTEESQDQATESQ